MIPFVPMIPGTVQEPVSGTLNPVILVGLDAECEKISVIMVATGVLHWFPSYLVKADPEWCANYANNLSRA